MFLKQANRSHHLPNMSRSQFRSFSTLQNTTQYR